MKDTAKKIIIGSTLVTISMYLYNKYQYNKSIEKLENDKIEPEYYEWKFGKIKYTKKGLGTPILLLHDLNPGSSAYEFRKITRILAKNHTVYTIDFLGYGQSEKPNMTYTNYLYVQLVSDFIKNIIGRETNIIASGNSGSIAIMTSFNERCLIDNMIIINPKSLSKANENPNKESKIKKTIIEIPVLGTFIYNLFTSNSMMKKNFKDMYFSKEQKIEQKDIDNYVANAHYHDYHSKYTFSSSLGNYMNANVTHALKNINKKFYIFSGEDYPNAVEIGQSYKKLNSFIKTIKIPKTKELPHLENPEYVLNEIKKVIR